MALCQCNICSFKWVSRSADRAPARCPSCQRRDWGEKAQKRSGMALPRGGGMQYSILNPRKAVSAKKRAAKAAAQERGERKKASA